MCLFILQFFKSKSVMQIKLVPITVVFVLCLIDDLLNGMNRF